MAATDKRAKKSTQNLQGRDQLIERYQRYVQNVASQMVRSLSLPPEYHDEFTASGYLGLVEAAERFDPKNGVPFKHFAYFRIRGAIIDGIRLSTDLSSRAYRMLRAWEGAQELRDEASGDRRTKKSEAENPTERLAEIMNYLGKSAMVYRLSTEDNPDAVIDTKVSSNPADALERIENQSLLRRIVSELPEKERMIIEGYYFAEKSFVDITHENAGLSKSWVSRLHARAIEYIKKRYFEETGQSNLSEPAADPQWLSGADCP